MNTACKLSAIASLALLGGCATSGMVQNEPTPGHSRQDSQYIAVVEDAARHAPVRVRVIWVKPPDEHVDE